MSSQQDISPKEAWRGTPKWTPLSLHYQTTLSEYLDPWPTSHVLAGYKWWCLGPLCMLYCIWICFFLAFTPFLLPLRCLVLLYVLVDVYPLWCEGCVSFWAHIFFLSSLFGLGITQAKAFIFIADWAHAFFFMAMGLLAINPIILLHRVCHYFVFLFTSYYRVGLRADIPAVSTYFFINPLLRASFTHLPRLYLFWAC